MRTGSLLKLIKIETMECLCFFEWEWDRGRERERREKWERTKMSVAPMGTRALQARATTNHLVFVYFIADTLHATIEACMVHFCSDAQFVSPFPSLPSAHHRQWRSRLVWSLPNCGQTEYWKSLEAKRRRKLHIAISNTYSHTGTGTIYHSMSSKGTIWWRGGVLQFPLIICEHIGHMFYWIFLWLYALLHTICQAPTIY